MVDSLVRFICLGIVRLLRLGGFTIFLPLLFVIILMITTEQTVVTNYSAYLSMFSLCVGYLLGASDWEGRKIG